MKRRADWTSLFFLFLCFLIADAEVALLHRWSILDLHTGSVGTKKDRQSLTTLDAVLMDEDRDVGTTEYNASGQISGIGARHLEEDDFHLGSVHVLIRAEPLGEENQTKAVRVWFILDDGDNAEVRKEYLTCMNACKSKQRR